MDIERSLKAFVSIYMRVFLYTLMFPFYIVKLHFSVIYETYLAYFNLTIHNNCMLYLFLMLMFCILIFVAVFSK